MSYRTWLWLGAALGLAACTGNVASGLPDSATPDAQYLIPPGDDASSDDGGIVSCSSRSGYFACGTNVCSRAIQACFSGSACVAYSYVAPGCGACPTCACLGEKTLLNIESCKEDVAGSITVSLYPIGGAGTPCKVDADCSRGRCINGVCECQPAGAVGTAYGDTNDCCSGWGDFPFSPDGGRGSTYYCWVERGGACSTTVPDCYGGPCEGGICACVGPGGRCMSDADCCAGAPHCVWRRDRGALGSGWACQ